ncbi:MAG: hypothetical protein LBD21_10105 [Tannerellaceae bacterium]|jgi:hypothetical protein|nr:hypothetical protein [Tannerellaceae bacterium]
MRKRIIAALSITLLLASCSTGQKGGSGKITAKVESTSVGESQIEYIQVSGLSGSGLQDKINDELHTFAIWPTVNIEDEVKVRAKAKYAIIADKYIAVRSELSFSSPIKREDLDSQIFDLETGDFSGSTDNFIVSTEAIINAFSSGKFLQVKPNVVIANAAELIAAELSSSGEYGFYLTDKSLGIYLPSPPGIIAGVDSDWAFEAPYSSITEVLTPSFRRLLNL